jgi:DNA-directed RNA polymerase subunit RPC12/RpoP
MTNRQQTRAIKCPHCGWERSIQIDVVEDESMARVAAGLRDLLRKLRNTQQATKQSTDLADANATIDIPKCANCGKAYRYNSRTGEVSK